MVGKCRCILRESYFSPRECSEKLRECTGSDKRGVHVTQGYFHAFFTKKGKGKLQVSTVDMDLAGGATDRWGIPKTRETE